MSNLFQKMNKHINDSSNINPLVNDKSFFKENPITTPSPTALEDYQKEPQSFSNTELNRIRVFRHIEASQPTTRYQTAKDTKLGYTTVRAIVRDLIFSGVVHEVIRLGKNGKTYKILSIPCESSEVEE